MKYLSDYIEEAQSKAFKDNGAFFAFSDDQFYEKRVEGVTYVSCGIGLICPKENAKKLMDELDIIAKKGMEQDLRENGKDGVIERELSNYECYYTGDITDAVDSLIDYGITGDDVIAVYKATRNRHE